MRCEIDLLYGTLACSERHSLSANCKVSSRLPAVAFSYALSSLRGFPSNRPSLVKVFHQEKSLAVRMMYNFSTLLEYFTYFRMLVNHRNLTTRQSAVSNRWTGLWTGSVDWIAGLDCWTGSVDWIAGLDCWIQPNCQ